MTGRTDHDPLELSARLWRWMSERDVDRLDELFAADAVFVHMGATFSKEEELEVIRSGSIHYRDIDVSATRLHRTGGTAVVVTTMRMTAVVGGDAVTNPFSTTGVLVETADGWRLAALAFTKLISG